MNDIIDGPRLTPSERHRSVLGLMLPVFLSPLHLC